MALPIAYLGPQGTYSELAALVYRRWQQQQFSEAVVLNSYPSILQAIQAIAEKQVERAIVPAENSVEGSVTVTLDALWQLGHLRIQQGLVLPIVHTLITQASELAAVETIFSHPQALGQCQYWLEKHCPSVTLVPTRSTTEALQHLEGNPSTAAIASQWAAQLYNLPVLAREINDQAVNCTKFWILGRQEQQQGNYTSLAFSLPVNAPGSLLKPLQSFAEEGINLSRIESRPTKRSLGEYLFFVDLAASLAEDHTQRAIQGLQRCTETLKLFGSYDVFSVPATELLTISQEVS